MWKSFSHVRLSVTPWTVAHQAPLSTGFPRQEYWSGLPCPPPGHLLNPGITPKSLTFHTLATDSLPPVPPGKPMDYTGQGILQVRILEWAAIPSSRDFSEPRDQTQVSTIAGEVFTSWASREAWESWSGQPIPSLVNLPDPGIELGSPALQEDSLPAKLPGKPQ